MVISVKKSQTASRFLLLAIIIVVQLVALLYFGSQKQGMHFDEYYSYFTTNNSDGRAVNDRSWLMAEDIRKDFYVCEGEQFQYEKVVRLQSYDVHPPIFYLLLHTICSLTPEQYSMWQGIALNILYAIISSVFLYLILEEISQKKWLSFVMTLLVALNPGVISNVMFIRMYMLMTMWMLMAVWLHIKMKMEWKPWYLLANGLLAYVGFLTHYFYLVFLFFLEASYWLPVLWKAGRQACTSPKKTEVPGIFLKSGEVKRFLGYFCIMLSAGILAVISYPACLGHMFSGYRGKEARGNFFNLSDLKIRFDFFTELMNEHVFHGCLLFVIIVLFLLEVFVLWLERNRRNKAEALGTGNLVQCMLIPALGYYFVSMKASLIGEAAMMRYQLPVYGMLLACILFELYRTVAYIIRLLYLKVQKKDRLVKLDRATRVSTGVALLFITVFIGAIDVIGMYKGQVYFCYPEQAKMVDEAKELRDETVVYLYHRDEYKYLIWGDCAQLWQYDKVYFASSENKALIEETEIKEAEQLVVYISRMGEGELAEYVFLIQQTNPKLQNVQKLYEGTYATAYLFLP